MPLNHGFWLHHQKRSLPPRPQSADCHPKPSIHSGQLRSSILSFQNTDLLPKDEVLQQQTASAAEDTKDDSEGESEERQHGEVIADSGIEEPVYAVDFVTRQNFGERQGFIY